jgi:hypothetical protein
MTRTISLITAVTGLALVLAVPALGKGQAVPQDFWNYDQQGQRIANTSPGVAGQDLATLYSGGGSDLRAPLLRPDAVDRAVAAREAQQAARPYPDAVERAVAARMTEGRALVFDNHRSGNAERTGQQLDLTIAPDAFERAVAAKNTTGRSLVFDNHRIGSQPPSTGRSLVFDSHRVEPAVSPTQITVSGSGREIEWPQIGVGLGIGIALMLGLFLTLRLIHVRPLAH